MANIETDFMADVEAVSSIDAVPSILEVICRTTGMGFAAVARVTSDRWIACAVRDEIQFGLKPGGELKVETTICHEIRQNHQAVVIDHVAEDELYAHHHTPAMYGIQSYISMPIMLKDGSFFGTLCAIDPRPARLKNPETIGMFKLFAELIAFHLNAIERLALSESKLKDELKTAELREQFIAILGHDLRNPLGAVSNVAQLLLRMPLDERTKRLATIVQDSSNVVQTLMNIGLVFSENNEEKKSIEILRKAISLGDKLKKDSIMSLVLCDYLLLYPDRIPKDSIAIYLAKARQIATRYKDNRSLLVTDQIQAQLYLKNKQREKGIRLLEETAAKGIAMDLNYLSLDIIQSLGDLYNPVDTAKAIARYKQGLNIADVKGYHMYQKIFGKHLYDIYIARNNLSEVQYYGKKLLKLYDDEEQFNNTSGFDYIDYALKDQQLEAITIRSKNRQIVAIILGVLFLLTAVTVLFIFPPPKSRFLC